jgi:Phage T7 capsid assembly protein
MAINISYDPSDDPQAIAEAEARDAESLELGEQMIKDQQDLLAGKYKNAEELEKAYLELQQRLGKSETTSEEEPEEETTSEESEDFERYGEDGSVNYDAVKEAYGDNLAEVFQEAGIDPWEMNDYFYKNDGALSEEMYNRLNQAGFNDQVIDAYLGGLRNQLGYSDAASVLSDKEVNEIKNLAGGEENYQRLVEWASENLSNEDIEAFDEVVSTANKAAVRFAVKALMSQYEDALGRDPELVTGKQSNQGQAYRSMAEVVRDMQDPRYDRDEAYRMDIMQKLERSNLKL